MKLNGGPTQDEIMAISLFKLGLKRGCTFADLGCGTGKVAIEASRVARSVYAIDHRAEAIVHAKASAESAGVSNVTFFEGEALQFLEKSGSLDCAFVGGSAGLSEVLEALSHKVSGNIVVNAVKVETLNEAVSTMRRLRVFKEALSVQVCRSSDIAGGTMFKPINPVYIIVGGRT
jgi:cobalt-precorrin-6B (C15)-methyltransferase